MTQSLGEADHLRDYEKVLETNDQENHTEESILHNSETHLPPSIPPLVDLLFSPLSNIVNKNAYQFEKSP